VRVLVAGEGPAAYHLVRRLAAAGHEVTVVVRDAADASVLARRVAARVVPGDGTDPVVLERAGARRAGVVLALASRDHENLATCRAAQRLFGVPRTVALVHDPDHEEVFRALGVTATLPATRILAQMVEGATGLGAEASTVLAAGGRLALSEVVLGPGAPAVGRPVRELSLPPGALLACLLREGEAIVPGGETALREGDRLVVVARPELHQGIVAALAGGTA
jgi:trk system potassium uptake protein TrkA